MSNFLLPQAPAKYPLLRALASIPVMLLVWGLLSLPISFGLLKLAQADGINVDDMSQPLPLIITTIPLITLIPACLAGWRWGAGRKAGSLFSVSGGMRWSLAAKALPAALIGHLLLYIVSLFPIAWNDPGVHLSIGRTAIFTLLAVIIFIPLQSASEEIAFRGWGAQLLAAILPKRLQTAQAQWLLPVLAYSIPTFAFVFMHGYGLLGIIDLTVFSICAAILNQKTGGLEIAIVMHAVGNVWVFTLGAMGLGESNSAEIPWLSTTASVLNYLVLTFWYLRPNSSFKLKS